MKIYLDVTETLAGGLSTGIQRVVRKIAARAGSKLSKCVFTAVPVIAVGSRFYAIDNFPSESNNTAQRSAHRHAHEIAESWVFTTVKKVIKPIPIIADLGRWALRHYRRPPFRRSFLDPISGSRIKFRSVKLEAGDVLVLLDSFWSTESALTAAEIAHRRGVRIVSVVYDLIPLTHPEYCSKAHVASFFASINRVLGITDAVISISADAVGRIRQHASSQCKDRLHALPVSHFYLGSDFSPPVSSDSGVRSERWPKELWDGSPVFVMVGTIEPRKGHAFVLEAFEQRWKLGVKDKLLIVGGVDVTAHSIMGRINSSPHYGRELFVIRNADDGLVFDAYRRSHACILASAAEGFGLPLVESLQMALPVLASDIPVFREIGGDYPLYFSLDNPNSLIQAFEILQRDYAAIRKKIENFRWLTWDEAAETFFSKVVELSSLPGTNRKVPDNLQRTFKQSS